MRRHIVESVSDTARVLLTAAVLSASASGMFVWRLSRLDPAGPERLIAQLRLAQWAALLLAATGAMAIGLAVANESVPFGAIEVTLGAGFIVLAAVVLGRDPRDGLLLVTAGFLAHALTQIAHQPDLLWPNLAPHWYAVGCAIFDLYIAALCYWARR
jgi:hypothetical protein